MVLYDEYSAAFEGRTYRWARSATPKTGCEADRLRAAIYKDEI